MNQRVTEARLQTIVDRINRVTGSPMTPWTKDDDGRISSNVGNYHLEFSYGAVSLARMANESGGINTIIHSCTKRELDSRMQSFLMGYEAAKQG